MQRKRKRFLQCMENMLWLIVSVKSGLWSLCWKFLTGLDDTPWLCRQVEVDGDQIETLIESNQHYTTQEIANILKISKSIKLLVKMKNVSFILWKKPYGLFGQPIHLHNGVLLGHKKEGNLTFCNSMDEPGEYYANEISQRKTTTIWFHLYCGI